MNQKIIVSVGILMVFLWISLGLFSIIPWQITGVLTAVSIGVPTLLLHYERGKPNESVSQTKATERNDITTNRQPLKKEVNEEQQSTTGSPLLPELADITHLKIDSIFLDRIYQEARNKANNIYNDAKLSYFIIQGRPFDNIPTVSVHFDFYSKWADKICTFQYSDLTSNVKHYTPNKQAKTDFRRGVFNDLPWKTSPRFLEALSRAYDKIKPLPCMEGTCYYQMRVRNIGTLRLKMDSAEMSIGLNGMDMN